MDVDNYLKTKNVDETRKKCGLQFLLLAVIVRKQVTNIRNG